MISVHHRFDVKATLALAGSVICWGVTPLFLKYFTPYIDGWTANGYRYPFAALLYLPLLISYRRQNPGCLRVVFKLALLPTCVNIIGQCLWAWSFYFINPGFMSFVVRLSTVWAIIGSFVLFYDERRLLKSLLFWVGFMCALLGFVGMTLTGSQPLAGATLIGLIIIFVCSIFWAAYNLTVRRNLYAIDSRVAFGMVSVLTASALLIIMSFVGEPSAALRYPLSLSVLVLISSVLGIALAHVFFYVALKRIGVAIATSVNLSAAFITAILSKYIFHEQLTALQWLSGSILVVGALMLTFAQTKIHPQKLA